MRIAVVNPAAAEPLRDDEPHTARTERVLVGRDPDVLVPHITLAAPAADRLVTETHIAQDTVSAGTTNIE